MVKVIRKLGGSYYALLPKEKVEFFGWANEIVYIDTFNSDTITIKRMIGATLRPKIKLITDGLK